MTKDQVKKFYEKVAKDEERAQSIFEAAVARYGAYDPSYPPRLWVGYLPDAIEYVEAVPECGMSPMEMAETMLEDSYRDETADKCSHERLMYGYE